MGLYPTCSRRAVSEYIRARQRSRKRKMSGRQRSQPVDTRAELHARDGALRRATVSLCLV
eukprot:2793155-Pleurochrysis_carterae.AAC.2